MVRAQQPFREAQTVFRQIVGHRRKGGGRLRLHRVAPLVVFAAEQNERRRRFVLFLHHVGDGAARTNDHFLLLERGHVLVQILVRFVEGNQPPIEKFVLFFGRALVGRLGQQVVNVLI